MKVLVTKRDKLGDLLLATPMLGQLKRALPGVEVHLLANDYNARLMEGHTDIDRVWVCRRALRIRRREAARAGALAGAGRRWRTGAALDQRTDPEAVAGAGGSGRARGGAPVRPLGLDAIEGAQIDPETLELYVDDVMRTGVNSARCSRTSASKECILKLGLPVHGIWGREDVTAHGRFDDIHAMLRSAYPSAQMHVIDGAGHWVQYERPEAFHGALERAQGRN
ncbi:MAG: hypothetical protein FJY51_01420 [Betaproteobacteria bacterium]|nr:hypothetical protein [Betaproteobacteria bacterium]